MPCLRLLLFLGIALPRLAFPAAQSPPAPCSERSVSPNNDTCYLQRTIRDWKSRMNLEEWTVAVRTALKGELAEGDSGLVQFDSSRRTATILLLQNLPRDGPESLEHVLVHELVHLWIQQDGPVLNPADEEELVERVTNLLLPPRQFMVHRRPGREAP